MSLVPNRAIEGAAGNQGYNLQRSLRFRSSASAYLNRTPASQGSLQTWTWSGWIKRGLLGSIEHLFSNWEYGGGNNNQHRIAFNTDDRLTFMYYDGPSNTYIAAKTPNMVFRDPAAWYHIVCTWDTTNATATDRIRVYVNGVRQTSFYSTNVGGGGGDINPSQNQNGIINKTENHTIGSFYNASYGAPFNLFDGYLAEVNFIDGQALTPSSFGEFSTETGVWKPKKYGGSYGTNGFYLPFSDNTSATTLAYDKSGNGNNWTPNNISTTAGSTYDSMLDVPTLTSATAANFATLNSLVIAQSTSGVMSFADANLSASFGSGGYGGASSTISAATGKWYAEFTLSASSNANGASVGIKRDDVQYASYYYPGGAAYTFGYSGNGKKETGGSASSYGASYTVNDVIGVAYDADSGTLAFYKNGTSQGNAYTGLTGSFVFSVGDNDTAATHTWQANFGQRPFSYTPPTGFKALNTFNLPDPTIKKPNQYMDATLYTGTGSDRAVTNASGFQPDLVMLKCRSNVQDNPVFDSSRGVLKEIYTDLTNSESTETTGLSAFNSNGFSLTSNRWNNSGYTFVGWQWKESATAGFDIVTYTGDGTNRNISHNLGVAPSMIIVKSRNATNGWYVCHVGSWGGDGNGLFLNNASSTYNRVSDLGGTGITAMTSSYFTATTGSGTFLNTSGTTYVAYVFAAIPGMSAFGSYTGNGSTDGAFVYLGFRPKYIMFKRTDTSGFGWEILDTSRDPYNVSSNALYANLSDSEGSTSPYSLVDIVSNGFKHRQDGYLNQGGATYIYAAFAENPFKYSNAR